MNVTLKAAISRLRSGERLRTGYAPNMSALFDNGDKVSHGIMLRLKKRGLVSQTPNGFIQLDQACVSCSHDLDPVDSATR